MAIAPIKAYVTPDDFKNYFGEDLYKILDVKDNESNYPNIVLAWVQRFLIQWCDNHGFRRVKYEYLQGIQLQAFQEAILNQTYYAYKNGLLGLGLESGYDGEKITLSKEDLERLEVPNMVVGLLHKSGLLNLKMRNRPRFNRGYPGIMGAYTGEDY